MSIDKFGRSHWCIRKMKENYSLHGPAVRYQLKFTSNGDYDFDFKKICNVKNPSEPQDSTTKSYVDDLISMTTNDFHNETRNLESVILQVLENRMKTIIDNLKNRLKHEQMVLDRRLTIEVKVINSRLEKIGK